MGHVVAVKGDGTELAHVLATVSQTPTAGVGDLVAADGTFVTGDVDDLDDIGIVSIATHGDLNTLAEDGTFFINTTTHC